MALQGPQQLISLDGQQALVAGGGSGIGRGIAELLAASGAHIVVLDRNLQPAEETVERIESAGGTAVVVQADVTDPDDVDRAIGEQSLNILVNAAGIIVRKSLIDTTHEEWKRVIDVNLTGYFNVLKAAIPALQRSGAGKVVQIASVAARIGYGYPSYTAAKGGVLSMTRQLAAELAPLGIRINSISLGVIETGINRDTIAQSAIRDATVGHTPQGRIDEPLDVAKVALFLVSNLSDFITGTDLLVDGVLMRGIDWGSAADALQHAHNKHADATHS